MVEALNPNNELELALESAQKKEASFDSFLFLFMNSDLFIASCSDLSVRGTNKKLVRACLKVFQKVMGWLLIQVLTWA